MENGKRTQTFRLVLPTALAAGLTFGLGAGLVGCKTPVATAPRTDQQVATDIQAKINAEQALTGQNIGVNVQDGRATLSGTTTDDASRALASNDAGSVEGVKTVINNLSVQPVTPASIPQAMPQTPPDRREVRTTERDKNERKRTQREQQATLVPPPPPSPPTPVQTPPPEAIHTVTAPPPPAKPVVKTVTIPAGTALAVRLTDALDSATTQPGSTFRGSLANDVVVNGMVAAPRGATVLGRVLDVKDAGHFKGNSLLSIELTTLNTHGQQIGLTTDAFEKEGSGRGKNTAEKAGVGAGLGAIIGALAGGGKGAAIGAAAGGGLGAGVNGVTRGQQVQIPSETLVNFTLRADVAVSTSQQLGGPRTYDSNQGPELQKRQ